MKLVTCFYDNLHGSIFNGRLNRGLHYLHSLKCIDGMNVPIVCYTSPENLHKLHPYVMGNSIKNLSYKNTELNQMYFHKKVVNVRKNSLFYEEDLSWQMRSIEIMWGKFIWLMDAIKDQDEEEYTFWIDAGLSHRGIINTKYNSIANQYETAQPGPLKYKLEFHNDLLFTPKLANNLVKYTGDKILNIESSVVQHSGERPNKYPKRLTSTVVGGLFGGKNKNMKWYLQECLKLCDEVLQEEKLLKEEEIMTMVYYSNNDKIKTFKFDTWYHEDWGTTYNGKTSFTNFFDEVLGNE